jgi:hypothetical protein
MIKRGLTLVNALNITPRILINDAAGPETAGPRTVCTTAPVKTPVLNEETGACRRQAWPTRTWSGSQLPVARDGPRRAAVVAVTNGRLDGSTELAEVFGTWERILCQLDG